MNDQSARILVIDDDPAIVRTIRKILERADHEVLEAEDGKKGLELARRERPDLIITDLIMPEVEGIETIQTLRAEFPDAKIIAVSGGGAMGPDSYLIDAEILGADRAMAKPFSPGELVAVVEELLGEGRQDRAEA